MNIYPSLKFDDGEYKIARVRHASVRLYRGTFIGLDATFKYADAGSQGFPTYCINTDLIKKFMGVFNVKNLKDVEGRYCLVKQSDTKIHKIRPIHPDVNGKAFDIDEWAEKLQEQREDDS